MAVEISKDRVRFMGLLYAKEGISFEQFDKYWREEHGPLFASLEIVKKNLLLYEQFHLNQPVTTAFQAGQTPIPPPPCVGVGICEAESIEKMMEIFASPEYNNIVAPDEEKFLERKMSGVFVGNVATFIKR